jgi:hypothetical protein
MELEKLISELEKTVVTLSESKLETLRTQVKLLTSKINRQLMIIKRKREKASLNYKHFDDDHIFDNSEFEDSE